MPVSSVGSVDELRSATADAEAMNAAPCSNEGEQAIGWDEQRGHNGRSVNRRLMPRWWPGLRCCSRRRSAQAERRQATAEPARRIVEALRQQRIDVIAEMIDPRRAPAPRTTTLESSPKPLLALEARAAEVPAAAFGRVQHGARRRAGRDEGPRRHEGDALSHRRRGAPTACGEGARSWCSGAAGLVERGGRACLAGTPCGSLARKKSRSSTRRRQLLHVRQVAAARGPGEVAAPLRDDREKYDVPASYLRHTALPLKGVSRRTSTTRSRKCPACA